MTVKNFPDNIRPTNESSHTFVKFPVRGEMQDIQYSSQPESAGVTWAGSWTSFAPLPALTFTSLLLIVIPVA